jgi:ribosomal protein S18 acetylase RimI-like enzyme
MLTDKLESRTSETNAARTRRACYQVERLTDPSSIRPLLEHQPVYAAYARGQLEPRLFLRSEWWRAQGPAGEALVLHARGGLGPALVALGDPEALDVLLRLHPGSRFTFGTFQIEHLNVVQRHFVLSSPKPSLRMAVSRESFRPAEGDARHLPGRALRAVNALQRSEGFSFYSPAVLDEGVYYGVYAQGRVVAMAGTHVVAPTEQVAIVGNVLTHPQHRGLGHGTVATSAVTAELLKTYPSVLLTVRADNVPGIRLYQRLGYREECRLIESGARRKDLIGLTALLRRFLARRRGEREGQELVPMTEPRELSTSKGGP